MTHSQEFNKIGRWAHTTTDPAHESNVFPSLPLLLACAVFVVYGSLVPFEFRSAAMRALELDFHGIDATMWKLRSLTDWVTNVSIFVPIGFFALATIKRRPGLLAAIWRTLVTLGGCILLSAGIEFTQIFFPPRDASVLDIVANTVGAALGIAGWFAAGRQTTKTFQWLAAAQSFRPSLGLTRIRGAALLIGCGLLIGAWGGFFTAGWTGGDGVSARLADIRIPPFLQHQSAAISLALTSTMLAALVYAPLGAVLWLLGIFDGQQLRLRLVATGALAASLALLVEGAKLFLVARNPDTGNIVIASLAAGMGYVIAPVVANRFARHAKGVEVADGAKLPGPTPATTAGWLAGRTISLVCAIAVCAIVVTYPIGQVLLGAVILIYVAILRHFPTAWLLAIPALLPALDLAPWTGRFFVDEFDGFVLATLALGYWQAAGRPLSASPGRTFWILAAGFVASFLASSIIGLLPLHPLDANALASHYSHYAALRQAKGLVFAAGLAVLISSHLAAGHDVKRALSAGMILGLTLAAGSVIWERLAYAGLLDFAKVFRVVGSFSTMHTGGSHLDAYLVTTIPFVAAWALRTKRHMARATAAILFAAGAYSIMVTFSRAAVAALLIVVLAMAFWAILSGRRSARPTWGVAVKVTVGVTLAGMVVLPVVLGSFMQSRLASTDKDFGTRNSHWSDSISIMTDGWSTSLFGMGLGRYAETYQLLSPEQDKPAVHRFENETGNTFLRLFPGGTLYVEQIVNVEPHQDYKVLLKAKSRGRHGVVYALLCDRTFLQGFGCRSVTFQMTAEDGKWQQFQGTLNSATVGVNRLRTVKFSLENAGSDAPIDVDEVALVDSNGKNHLANGSFQAGADRWFFSTPYRHLPWHIKNLWLEVFFGQGWVGLLTFCALVTATVVRLARLAWRGKTFAAALLAAMLGFLAVGAFDSLFDAPRLTLTFGLLVAAAGIAYARPVLASQPLSINGTDEGMDKPSFIAWEANPSVENSVPGERIGGPTINHETPTTITWRKTAVNVLACVLLMAICIATVTRVPFVPYNLRELPNPFHPLLAPILLATFFLWVFGMPAIAAHWLAAGRNRGAAYPLLVAAHGLLGWAMLSFAVLPESIHDVIGSPVLNWPLQMEYIARFVPLVSVLSVQLTGGALIAAAMTGNRTTKALSWWFLYAALLFPVQYWVVVTWAATDNLTELMAANASPRAFLLLSLYLLLIGITGSLIASLRAIASPRRIGLASFGLVLSLPLGYLLLWLGTEAVIVKGQAFSALQFLFSADRAHYATGHELWIRYAAAHLAAVGLTAMMQYPLWMKFRERYRHELHQRHA